MINSYCSLVIKNIYHYDISRCYYNILKSINYNLEDIDPLDKKSRNIKIGFIQKNNPIIASYLNNCTNNLIDNYLIQNNIHDSDVIIRNKDGIYITKKLLKTDISIPIDFRYIVNKIIIDCYRKSYILIIKDGIEVKCENKKLYDNRFYKLISNINFSDKRNISNNIENVRQCVFKCDDYLPFVIKDSDDLYIPVKKYGNIKIDRSIITNNMININDIDKLYIWTTFIWKYCRSIILTYL